jgi:hypothetical protein
MTEKKFQNLKPHDCHVIMTQLLPIALRGFLPKNVHVPIEAMCIPQCNISKGNQSRFFAKVIEGCGPMSC